MNLFRRARTRAERGEVFDHQSFAELEPRVLLSTLFGAELPDLDSMEDRDNIIVRFQTNVEGPDGESYFDIELFTSEADDPIQTVDNFLTYIRDGQYDGVFFQRLQALNADPSSPPEILQGGRNRIDDVTGEVLVNESRDPVVDEVGRENDARTIAMAKTSSPDSATNQFYINLTDNEDVLGPDVQANGGFTVFARVLDDRSWDVVTTIADLMIEDLRSTLSDPVFGGGSFSSTPVTDAFDPDAEVFTDDMFVTILDVEIIKPEDIRAFYDQSVYISEGYRNFRSNEVLTVTNTNDEEAAVQVILRYATGEDRDLVVDFGTFDAGEQRQLQLSGPGRIEGVIGFIPYAVEVQTASEDASSLPVTAVLTRADYGDEAAGSRPFVGQALFNPESIAEADRETTLTSWLLADGVRDDDNAETFITWVNLTNEPGEVSIEFFFENAESTQTVNVRDLGPYRRGGVHVEGIGKSVLPEGAFSARVTSTVPIVASMTTFQLGASESSISGADLSIGVPGEAGPRVALADIRRLTDGGGEITVLNLGEDDAIVRFDFIDSSGNELTSIFNRIDAGRLERYGIDAIPGVSLIADRAYSVIISSQAGGPDIAAGYSATSDSGGLGAPILPFGGTRHVFGDARFDDSAGFQESISIYNPNDTSIMFNFIVNFGDGTRQTVTRTLAPGARSAIDLSNDNSSDLDSIQDKLESDPSQQNFGVTVTSTDTSLVALTRLDGDDRFTTIGTIMSGFAPIN